MQRGSALISRRPNVAACGGCPEAVKEAGCGILARRCCRLLCPVCSAACQLACIKSMQRFQPHVACPKAVRARDS
ncbi:hypothetical protein K469DRAFT_166903 [Zopfia rhizophila CBS 207.26]|uniref:Uncharacterized protein n=1 Tax=Zopfia rhizophila CBS 207.26 TaxID=1314779 RepID=A0A6A6E0B8_9PEZI|nr:hypothetical protein K469DRAFT_166903 [Zopfia rhizophila CBS 207.26]